MKKKRPRLQLSDEQQLALGLLIVILVAVSLLYCLGFASLALRQAWEDTTLPWATPEVGEEILDTPEILPPVTPGSSPTPSSLLPRGGISFDRTPLHSYNLHAAGPSC